MVNYDSRTEEYWSKESVKHEMDRIFDICNGCRLCDNLCPSFVFLFDRIDEEDDKLTKVGERGDPLKRLTGDDYQHVVDLCYDCKLCFPKCPYVPPHQYMLDFPRLMLRARAVHSKKEGIPFRERMLGKTEFLGKVGSVVAPLMNWVNQNRLSRVMMEKTIGIHRDKALPKYCSETFVAWFKKHQKEKIQNSTGKNARVVFFYTCSVNYNYPDIGKEAVAVLEKNDIEVICPEQVCCGMPQLGSGNIKEATKNVDANVKALTEVVKAGYDIVIPGPSCSLMMKQEYPHLSSKAEEAQLISQHSFDICEYLMKLHREGKLNTDFKQSAGKIVYHVPCHIRAQNIGLKSRDLIKLIPDTEIEVVQNCSGHDGTWSMKREYYEMSLKVGDRLFKRMENAQPATIVSDCPLSHLHIAQGTKRESLHPIQIIHKAYGLNSRE